MPSRDLRAFLVDLNARGQLARVKIPVDPFGELAALMLHADHHLQNAPALLFEQVNGSPFRVAANLTGTADRMARALFVRDLDEIRTRVETLFDLNIPRGAMGMIERMADFMNVAHSLGITANPIVRNPPLYDHLSRDPGDLSLFPAIKFSPQESFPSFTNALLITVDRRIRTTRAAVIDRGVLAVRIAPDDEKLIREPAAVVLGADPALVWSADLPLPEGFDRGVLAGWLRGRFIPQATGVTQAITLPADAEAAFEGSLTGETLPIEWLENGSIVTETVFRFNVTAIAHRDRAIIPVRSAAHAEIFWSRRAAERLFLPVLKTVMPRLTDLTHLSADHAVAHVRVSNDHDMIRLGYGVWGLIPHLTRLTVINELAQSTDHALQMTAQGVSVIARDQALHNAASESVTALPPLPRSWNEYQL